MVTVTIDGREASGREGMTILDLAEEMKIPIPTLCHDSHLASYGACRVCLVEEEKSGALLASCVAPLSPGMVIRTDSPRVLEARRMIVKLMLASHPESCLVCEKGNRCQLRQIALDLGIGLSDLYRLPNYSGTQEVNPFIKRDLSKCILCGKCIRADHELVVEGAIDYFHRGFDARPATLHDQALESSECTFCGACVDICPTGALSERDRPLQSTPGASFSSVCPYCGCGCKIFLGVNGERVVAVNPDREDGSGPSPVLCVKGHYGLDFIDSASRLRTPLIRKEGRLVECSWEEALDCVGREMKRIQDRYGPDALAFLGSPQCTNEENYLFQKLARAGFGTNNIDHGNPFNTLPAPDFFGPGLGWGAMTSPLAAIEEAKGILVVGANPEETAPLAAYKIKRAVRFQGANLYLVDPRRTRLVPFARDWLRPRLGGEASLLLGFVRVILDEELWEKEWVERNVEGLKALREEMEPWDLARAERDSGIGREVIRGRARDLASCWPRAFILGNGIWQGVRGRTGLAAAINLALLLGCQRRFYPLGMESNGQGARDMGALPHFLPGYQSWEDEETIKRFEKAWGGPLPRKNGLSARQMVREAAEGKVRGMYIMGENPVRSFPDASRVREALGKLEFLAVQDLFLTETAQMARVVLSASSFAEKEGTLTNGERRVQLLRAAAQPAGQSLPDWKILTEVFRRAGGAPLETSPREVMEEISSLVPFYRGVAYARLEKMSLILPCGDPQDEGTPRLPERAFQAGKQSFLRVPENEFRMAEDPAGAPFRLLVGSTLYHSGGGTRSSRSARLSRFDPRGGLRMNPGDALALGLEGGSRVKLSTEKKEMVFRLSLDAGLPPGVLFFPLSPAAEERVIDLLPWPSEGEGRFPVSTVLEVQVERIKE
ncbi:MAG: molybdopterin-dependent oxidoreductase [Syntrophaceae bacterium]|nr:molybdopterin-dependent oxidoreductase [Syntrophaceae bacterium]